MIPSTLPPEHDRHAAPPRGSHGSRSQPNGTHSDGSHARSGAREDQPEPQQPFSRWDSVRSLPLSRPVLAWADDLRERGVPQPLAEMAAVLSGMVGAMVGAMVGRAREVRRKTLVRRLLNALMLVLIVGLACFTLAWNRAPSTATLDTWVRGQDTARSAPYTSIDAVSPNVVHALVATEDERFYQHHGIDTLGLMRALLTDIKHRRIVEGGSTLTAQLAKNAYLGGYDRTVRLKLEDLLLALKIEHRYSKSQILEMYLNLVYFGEGAYGIGSASQRYFGVAPAKLDVAQAALLAGLVQAPGMYDPWCHPGLARAKQQTVLTRMVADGYITPAQEKQALSEQFAFFASGATRPNDAYCVA